MATLANTKENNTIVKALKKIKQTQWVGNTVLENIESCLTSINLESAKNSGWYKPTAIIINGLLGIYMVNEDGSICYDFRVIKEADKKYRIETMTMGAYNEFENLYCQLLEE